MADDVDLELLRDTAQLVAEGLTLVTGFSVAVIQAVRGDDDHLTTLAVAGSEDARRHLMGQRLPVAHLEADLALADTWGTLLFVPGERVADETERDLGWIPDIAATDDPTLWHPLDLLVAPFRDEQGRLRGHMCIDLPRDGRRPDPSTRVQLQAFAEQARRVVFLAHERQELAEQVRLAATTRALVRSASATLELEHILDTTQAALLAGFNASLGWLQTFDHRDVRATRTFSADGEVASLDDELGWLFGEVSTMLWQQQGAGVLSPQTRASDVLTARQRDRLVHQLTRRHQSSALLVPMGAAGECLGLLVLTRTEHQPSWSRTEIDGALDIGHDLGRAVLNARTLARERSLVAELRALDVYKRQLIATVAHELTAPVAATMGHLELLESAELPLVARRSLEAIQRATERSARTIEDLLVLSRVADPEVTLRAETLDLVGVVREAVALVADAARGREIEVTVALPAHPLEAVGDPVELERMVVNLVGNAVKYSDAGGVVDLVLTDGPVPGHCVLAVRDDGLGISRDDQQRLFEEFFRSTNPAATQRPGNGLGLAIVKRVVERHGGRIEVDSVLGRGSTFTVILPATTRADATPTAAGSGSPG